MQKWLRSNDDILRKPGLLVRLEGKWPKVQGKDDLVQRMMMKVYEMFRMSHKQLQDALKLMQLAEN